MNETNNIASTGILFNRITITVTYSTHRNRLDANLCRH